MTSVHLLLPNQKKISDLALAFIKDFDDEERRAFAEKYITTFCHEVYRQLMETHKGQLTPETHEIFTEMAFWRGLYRFLRFHAKFAIADNLGFLPPHDEDIVKSK